MAEARDILANLTTPTRNHYFYGKLLDVRHFEMEQNYLVRKRWLMNRLGLGSGVLCGLEVTLADNGQCVWVHPGVAIDSLGREIIVPRAYCLEHPFQVTDELGRPLEGDEQPIVTICLVYMECEVEPVPIMSGDCDTDMACANSVIQERYRLIIRAGLPETQAGLNEKECTLIFGPHDGSVDYRQLIEDVIGHDCTPTDECVVLATLRRRPIREPVPLGPRASGDTPVPVSSGFIIDQSTYRRVIYSNTTLLDLILCLAERVEECCNTGGTARTLFLLKASEDPRPAPVATVLLTPVIVEVLDDQGQPVEGVHVTFFARDGGAIDGVAQVPTDVNGRASAKWRLGPQAGQNRLIAGISSGANVLFTAEGQAVDLPVIRALQPPNAFVMKWSSWKENPRLELTFSHAMDAAQLQNPTGSGVPSNWLRVSVVVADKPPLIAVSHQIPSVYTIPIDLTYVQDRQEPAGQVVDYELDRQKLQDLLGNNRYENIFSFIVQIRPDNGAIMDSGTPPLLLDADFVGLNKAEISDTELDDSWQGPRTSTAGFASLLTDTGAILPSGDSKAGGWFRSWFQYVRSGSD